MNRMMSVALALTLLLGCRSEAAPPDRFVFVLHDGLTAEQTAHLKAALDEAYNPVLSRLGLETMPTVTVQIWGDEEAYQTAMEAAFGSRAPGSRGYAYGQEELRLLYHTRLSAQREAVHEFVHVATLNMNPDFGNNPRWLWEALAQYLAGEFVNPSASGVFDDGTCPSLVRLNSPFDNGGMIYATGYLLVDFIEKTWGFDSVVEMVRNNGDLESTLGVDATQFEQRWCEFVGEAYSER